MRATDSIFPLFLCCFTACGGEAEEPSEPSEAQALQVYKSDRIEKEWAGALRQAIEFGGLERAKPLLELHAEELGVEAELLSARLLAAEGKDLDAQRAIERARRAAPDDVRVPSTASEMHSAYGRSQSALDEIKRAYELGGARPEIYRAQGVYFLSQSGRAKEGLELLLRAREMDPMLPFLDRATAQAHLLLAKESLAKNDLNGAMKAVEQAYQLDPEEFETRRLLSDVLLAQKRVEDALVVMEALYADGYPVLGELASLEKQAAFVKLLRSEREGALDLFVRARTHGLSEVHLGSGAQMLLDAAQRASEEGVKAYEGSEFERARDRFERAIELDPGSLPARNHLGVVCYQLEDDKAAIEQWVEVWRVAMAEGLELPEAVEVNLARAYVRSGAVGEAKRVLQESLEISPSGPHSELVQQHLDVIIASE